MSNIHKGRTKLANGGPDADIFRSVHGPADDWGTDIHLTVANKGPGTTGVHAGWLMSNNNGAEGTYPLAAGASMFLSFKGLTMVKLTGPVGDKCTVDWRVEVV